ncbi:MAG: hypothetical protein NVS3B18_07960 [Candidatus Dormibacteria bacterium]
MLWRLDDGLPLPAGTRGIETLAHAARRVGVSTKTLRRRVADGTVGAYRVGPRLIRVDIDAMFVLRPNTKSAA